MSNDAYLWNLRDAANEQARQERLRRETQEVEQRRQREAAAESVRRQQEWYRVEAERPQAASARYAEDQRRSQENALLQQLERQRQQTTGIAQHRQSALIAHPQRSQTSPPMTWHEARLARFRRLGKDPISQAPIQSASWPGTNGMTMQPEDRERSIRRNAPCPCGSGAQFKHCHGQCS